MQAWFGHAGEAGLRFECVDLPDPEPGEGELLVRVCTAGVNRVDLQPRQVHFGHMPPAPGPVPCLEAAGDVVAVGAGVDAWRPGDRVMGMVQGGCASLVRLAAPLAMRVPEAMDWEVAAAIPVSCLTAHDALVTEGRCAPGAVVLVHAATSGVGMAALQLARLHGASLVAGSSASPAASGRLERLRPLGLDLALPEVYAGFADRVLAESSGAGADVVVDNIGGRILNETLRATALGGRIVDVGRLGGVEATLDLNLLALRRARLIGVTFRTRSLTEHAAVVSAFLADHATDLVAGRLIPPIDRVYPFSEAPIAVRRAGDGTRFGKVIIRVQTGR